MTAERWQIVKDVLQGSLELTPVARSAYLAKACSGDPELLAEVQSLLEATDEAGAFLDEPAMQVATLWEGEQEQASGEVIGQYTLLEEIGRGGMGTVYLAVRDGEYHQQVAVKLVKRGMDTDEILNRFRYERQILAYLNHPHIAQLLDGGSTGLGRPYFVMEYIRGLPVTDYCERHRLELSERLKIFGMICSGVAHAHRNLIVHRDLKPGNILVTDDGLPKLLDFGIAKILLKDAPNLATQTRASERLLTPDYASPEQVRGEAVTTATDIYSLGAILYEMLTAKRAHQFGTQSPTEIERVICQETVRKPSMAAAGQRESCCVPARLLRGDLDNIVMKAMHKDHTRRYGTVEQLADDLNRFSRGLPVSAREDTLVYRTKKFAGRHKAAVSAAAIAVFALVLGTVVALQQARVANAERERAERRFNDVRKLANAFLMEHDVVAALPGGTALRGALVQRSLEYLDRLAQESAGDRSLQQELASAYEKTADVQGRPDGPNMGNTSVALISFRKALAIREVLAQGPEAGAIDRVHLAETYVRMSQALKVTGDFHSGLAYDRKALAVRQALLETDPQSAAYRRLVAASYTTLGGSLSQLGDWKGVVEHRRKALASYSLLAAAPGASNADRRGLTLAHVRLGSILARDRKVSEAMEQYRAAIALAREELREAPHSLPWQTQLAAALTARGRTFLEAGNHADALRDFREAHGMTVRVAESDANDARAASVLATNHAWMGRALLALGSAPAALREFRTSLAMRQKLAGRNALSAGAWGELAESYATLGDAYLALKRRDWAVEWYEKSKQALTSLRAKGQTNTADLNELARVERQLAKLPANARSR